MIRQVLESGKIRVPLTVIDRIAKGIDEFDRILMIERSKYDPMRESEDEVWEYHKSKIKELNKLNVGIC